MWTPWRPQAAKIEGVRKVLTAAERRARPAASPRPYPRSSCPLMANYDALLVPATSAGKNFAPRVAALLDVAPISEITRGGRRQHLRAADLCGQRPGDRRVERRQEGDHRAADRLQGGRRGRLGRHRGGRPRSRRAQDPLRLRRAGEVRPSGTGRGEDRRLRRPRHGLGRGVPAGDRAAGRQARRRGGRLPRGGGRRLRAERLPGRPDRQGRGAATLRRQSASPAPSSTWPA